MYIHRFPVYLQTIHLESSSSCVGSGSRPNERSSLVPQISHRRIGLLACLTCCRGLSCSRVITCDRQFQHFRGLAHDAITPQNSSQKAPFPGSTVDDRVSGGDLPLFHLPILSLILLLLRVVVCCQTHRCRMLETARHLVWSIDGFAASLGERVDTCKIDRSVV